MAADLDDLVTHRTVDLGDVRLHLAEAGEGPLVVLLHGFPEFWYSWRHQIPALAEAGYHVVAPDLRGYNLSDKPTSVHAYRGETLAADVARLVAACGAERATIVGHDWGGAVAWLTALLHPQVVERLAVLNVPHPVRFADALRSPLQLLRSSYMLLFQLPVVPELLLSAGRGAALRWILRAGTARRDAFDDVDMAHYAAAYSQPGAVRGGLAYYRSMGRRLLLDRSRDRSGRRPVVGVPTLVIWGERDPAMGAEFADPGTDLVPDLRVEMIPDAGHFVQAEAPDRVNELLLAFLREC